MKKQRILGLCLASLLALSLAACSSQADGRNGDQPSVQPTASTQPAPQPTAAPAPTPTPPPIPYTDVAEDSPYYDAVVWAYKNGIASEGKTFDPAGTCTRGQVITFLWRAMGSPEPWIMENPLSDASPADWYYKPALWAYQHSIAAGTTFHAGNPCTNAEALTFLWRAEGRPDRLSTLAASNTYYGQPAAWAEKNGLFTGTEFDPAVPCSRANFMTYLYWAAEQWKPSEEERKIQTEYDKILYGLDIYAGYADYVDVDGDGRAELLTLENRYNSGGAEVAAAVYADMDGHVAKSCEAVFQVVGYAQNTPEDTFLTDGGVFSLYRADGQLYLCQNRSFYEPSGTYPRDDDLYDFYKIEKEAITFCEQQNIWTMYDRNTGEEQKGDTGTSLDYTKQKDILQVSQVSILGGFPDFSFSDAGILPGEEGRERYWTACWEASDPNYATVLKGDFSAFAGSYADKSGWAGDIIFGKDGVVTGNRITSQKPVSVTVREDGAICCTVKWYEEEEPDGGIWRSSERYIIYPVGIADEGDPNNPDYQSDPAKVRMEYWWPSHGVDVAIYSRIS